MDKGTLGCVYSIKCVNSGRIYIGQTINFKRRDWEHKNLLRKGLHKNKYLQQDFNLYGEESLKFDLIQDNLNLNDRKVLETYYIQYYGGIESNNVYNYQDNITENREMRKSVSDNQKGKVIKQESIDKMRKSLTGRKLSNEHKLHIKQSCSKFIGENNPAKRPEVRRKLSEKLSGKGNGMYGKRKYTQDFIQLLRNEYSVVGKYKTLAVKYNISCEVVSNLIKYGQTFNPNSYYKKRKM